MSNSYFSPECVLLENDIKILVSDKARKFIGHQ